MVLLIDNYDSFTYNIFQYYRILKKEVIVVRNDKLNTQDALDFDPELIVVSPGPGRPETAGNSRRIIEGLAGRIPILGICLGMQTIASCFGGRIIRAPEPIHGKNSSVKHDGIGLFEGLPNPLVVTRYHSLLVDRDTLPSCLEVSAETEEGLIMGLRHRALPLEGVQFHPEAYMTQNGLDMIRNSLPKGSVC